MASFQLHREFALLLRNIDEKKLSEIATQMCTAHNNPKHASSLRSFVANQLSVEEFFDVFSVGYKLISRFTKLLFCVPSVYKFNLCRLNRRRYDHIGTNAHVG